MSWKSIRFSIYAVLLTAAVFVAMIFLFKVNIAFGFLSLLLLIFPAKLQRIAVDESGATLDKIIAKFVVPALAALIMLATIFSLAFWIK